MIRRRRIVVIAILFSLPLVLFFAGAAGGFRVNLTPSYPLGLWRITRLHRDIRIGDRIFICPPLTPAFELARKHGYLRRGLCPGWLSPLIKTVVALPGQDIEIGTWVLIDGRTLPNSKVQAKDGAGRALKPYAGGIVPAGDLFLHSPFKGSYDSRYFGPVPANGVLGLATPVITFTP
ncbi:conjugal transfer pilin processing protease TraF (plasmid) [Hartmannibacter diazotrophicus]|uniref:Conjugal transfer pilin processing protease TraF n=1 Tax=Hartmannibacter diazotrophicus TaxID=1482074 RepID=A0A2C9DDT4_9HYPH|nr:conjugative transfer signal peptidase TraF [Hartmannibacter diazotrophicus]SON58426.1 conjugal transfer pilin processing protease TraF [Hartmannibacter diazotrophicus]